jgi:hypothetical protein
VGGPSGRSGLWNYLRCTVVEVGLILNFGPAPNVRRLVFANERKRSRAFGSDIERLDP